MSVHPTSLPVTTKRVGSAAVVTIDNPPVNVLSREVRMGLLAAFTTLAGDHGISTVVLTGAGRNFVAGADIREMDGPPIDPQLPQVIAAIEALPQPVIAAIGGPALGGGLELALACDHRLASANATLGLPETKLGIVPGAGGTQRLPRLTGLAAAVEMIGEAKILDAGEAEKLGLVDGVVTGDPVEAALAMGTKAAKRVLSGTPAPASDPRAEELAAAAIRRARGAEAVREAVELTLASARLPFAEAIKRERATFLRLRQSEAAAALRHLFLAERAAAKPPRGQEAEARRIDSAVVIGGGFMGCGIATALATSGIRVSVVEQSAELAAAAAGRIETLLAQSRRRAGESAEQPAVATGADWAVIKGADLVIEAVFDDLPLKTGLFRRLATYVTPGTTVATNTSYLDIEALVLAAPHPESFIGLHFFSPAQVMRLLEVIPATATSPETLATGLALGKRLGKLPVIAGREEGFIGNRIFSLYRSQMEYLVEDGATPQEIDAAMRDYGFAMGPFAVFDMAGLDIAWAKRKRDAAKRDPRLRYVDIPDRLCEAGRLGRKTGKGWYNYATGKPEPDPDVEALIAAERARKGIAPRRFTPEAIQRRALASLVDTSARLLASGGAARPSDIDLVLVHGYGFPRAKGGPMFAADRIGLRAILEEAEAAAKAARSGMEAAPLLRELAGAGLTFAEWQRRRA